ncbi:hypothetical protein [Natrarchaeobius oligotrophus]|uniref:Uncharacterized protein n=1 Tax=Natrarchaeobius chitinivorans TaxID=1679083 RepID=A0A3N6N6D0_NATCH|nr:hypothetical protein [Natrarchaeobius chitinivorans]RQH03507.1 hypothetical protein EA472_02850 [Natrarchaeobius chitinivorans]
MSNRTRLRRRTVLWTLGSVGVTALSTAAAAEERPTDGPESANDDRCVESDPPDTVAEGATRYVAVVDRIVDGEHVVLLLEEECTLVDQLVVSVDEFETVGEGDILMAVIRDDRLLSYRFVSERPPC